MTEVQEQQATADMVAEGSPAAPVETGEAAATENSSPAADEARAATTDELHDLAHGAVDTSSIPPPPPTPATIGRIVQYRLTPEDAFEINRRRGAEEHGAHWPFGAIAHVGNHASRGDVVPMLIVKVWGPDYVNGQVHLDGNDTLWKTSVTKSKPGELIAGEWQWPTLS